MKKSPQAFPWIPLELHPGYGFYGYEHSPACIKRQIQIPQSPGCSLGHFAIIPVQNLDVMNNPLIILEVKLTGY